MGRVRVSGVRVFPLGGVKVIGLFREQTAICLWPLSLSWSLWPGAEMTGVSFHAITIHRRWSVVGTLVGVNRSPPSPTLLLLTLGLFEMVMMMG